MEKDQMKKETQFVLPAKVTLASASPRRKELLARIGIDAVVCPSDADESSITLATVPQIGDVHDRCRQVTLERARAKASVVSPAGGTPLAIAADTTVDAGGVILDKPVSKADARFMLGLLAGTTHLVHSAVIVYGDPEDATTWLEDVTTSSVTFTPLTDQDLEWYFSTGEWQDVAGGYRIQGRAGVFVQHLAGSYETVMGLPIHSVYSMIRRFFTASIG